MDLVWTPHLAHFFYFNYLLAASRNSQGAKKTKFFGKEKIVLLVRLIYHCASVWCNLYVIKVRAVIIIVGAWLATAYL